MDVSFDSQIDETMSMTSEGLDFLNTDFLVLHSIQKDAGLLVDQNDDLDMPMLPLTRKEGTKQPQKRSFNYLKPTISSAQKSTRTVDHINNWSGRVMTSRLLTNNVLKRPKKLFVSDGTELDNLPDISFSLQDESRFKVAPKQGLASIKKEDMTRMPGFMKSTSAWNGKCEDKIRNKVVNELRRSTSRDFPRGLQQRKVLYCLREKPKQKPILIRNTNYTDSAQTIGNMVYNPRECRWEGGSEDIDMSFEMSSKPALKSKLLEDLDLDDIFGEDPQEVQLKSKQEEQGKLVKSNSIKERIESFEKMNPLVKRSTSESPGKTGSKPLPRDDSMEGLEGFEDLEIRPPTANGSIQNLSPIQRAPKQPQEAVDMDQDLDLEEFGIPDKLKPSTSQVSDTTMYFDADKMCWVGNEEELDAFSNVSSRASTPTPKENREFQVTDKLREQFCIMESQHLLFMGEWFVGNSRMPANRLYLHEIRNLCK